MARQFFSGNTLDQALLAAARHYGLEPDRVAYSLRDKKHGFLNNRRKVVIEVDPSAPELEAICAGGESEGVETGSEGKSPSAVAEVWGRELFVAEESWQGNEALAEPNNLPEEEAFSKGLAELMALLGSDLKFSMRRSEQVVEIELDGPDKGSVLDDQGKALQAMEHLLPRLVRGFVGHGVPCKVDCGGFRASRELELQRLALSVADEVRRNANERTLEPLNPADRRIVHLALAEDPAVQTESEGGGFLKRVRILPS